MPNGILIGLMSGLASAVLFYSAARGGVALQMLLHILTPLPMMIVGLAFGWRAAVAAATAGAALMAGFGGGKLGFVFLATFGGPSILCAWLAELGKSGRDSASVAWLPAGDILAAIATAGGIVPVLFALANGGSFATMRPGVLLFMRDLTREMSAQLKTPAMPPERIERLADVMIDSLPGVLAAYWVLLFVINLYLAGRIARTSGLLIRPWPDLHRLVPPPWMLLLLVAALFLFMTGGLPKIAGTALVGALSLALLLYGLSVLHAISKGRVPWLLWLTYAAFITGPYAMVVVAMLGLIEPLINLRGRLAKAPTPPEA